MTAFGKWTIFLAFFQFMILFFLMSVVSLYRFIEKLVVSITQILLNEHDVIRSS